MQKSMPLCCSVTEAGVKKNYRNVSRKRGFPNTTIAVTLKYLKQAGYLDDHALALDLKRQAFNNKLLGHNRAKIFLLDRGSAG